LGRESTTTKIFGAWQPERPEGQVESKHQKESYPMQSIEPEKASPTESNT